MSEEVEVVCITQGGCGVNWTATKEPSPAGTALMTVRQHQRIVDALKAERDQLRAELAAIRASEPVAYQFQDRDGEWNSFVETRHYEATVRDGTWPIRPLYTTPQPHPDVQALAEALDGLLDLISNQREFDDPTRRIIPRAEAALAAYRKAK